MCGAPLRANVAPLLPALTADLAALVEAFGYGLVELEQFQFNAAQATFLPAPARADLAERIRAGFAAARDSGSSSQS